MIGEVVIVLIPVLAGASFGLGVIVGGVLIPGIMEIVRLKRITRVCNKITKESRQRTAAMLREQEQVEKSAAKSIDAIDDLHRLFEETKTSAAEVSEEW